MEKGKEKKSRNNHYICEKKFRVENFWGQNVRDNCYWLDFKKETTRKYAFKIKS